MCAGAVPSASRSPRAGHYIVVVPYLDLVVVHRANTDVPGRNATGSQFGRLMQLIVSARK